MKNHRSFTKIPPEGINTPDGYLYYPPKQWTQILFLLASFSSAIFLGFIISSIPGDLSKLAEAFIYFIYIFLFFLGYSSWVSLTGTLIFKIFKLPFIKVLYRFIVHREKPDSINDFLPTREKAIEILLRTQKNTKTYYILSWPVGIAGGFLTMFISTSMDSVLLFTLILISTISYGYVLFYFGRKGYFPFPEG